MSGGPLGQYTRSDIDNFTDDRIGVNLLLWSEDFTHVGWNARNGHVATADQTTAPNGTNTADLITVTAGSPGINQGLFAEGGTVNGPYCFSLHLKAAAGITTVTMVIKDRATDTVRGSKLCTLTSTWSRFPVLATTQGATPGFRIEFQAEQANGTFYVWGGDVKLGWSYTAYVATQGAIAGR